MDQARDTMIFDEHCAAHGGFDEFQCATGVGRGEAQSVG